MKPCRHLLVTPGGPAASGPAVAWMNGLAAFLRGMGHEAATVEVPAPADASWTALLEASLRTAEVVEATVGAGGIDVIDAPDTAGLLYVLLRRRALGLAGAGAAPPVVVHVLEPARVLAEANEEDALAPATVAVHRLQESVLRGADAVAAPSALLVRSVAAVRMEGDVAVLPAAAVGQSLCFQKETVPAVASNGTVLFLGGLEARRGALEWAAACVALARRRPDLRFEFAGRGARYAPYRDRPVREQVERTLPADVRERFRFAPEGEPLAEALARARLAGCAARVEGFVPEIFEALAAGRPVAVTGALSGCLRAGAPGCVLPEGAPSAEAWAEALERALDGGAVAADGTGDGGAQAVAAFYERVARRGAARAEATAKPCGVAVVVTCYNLGEFLPDCLTSLREQTVLPACVVVVDDGSTDPATLGALRRAEGDGWRVVRRENGGLVAARNTGIEAVRAEGGDELGAYVFLDADDRLRPRFAEVCGAVLERLPGVGLVSCWTHHFGAADALWARPDPEFPHQWVSNGAATFSAVRAAALRAAGGFRPAMERGYEDWDLFNAVLAGGWAGVTVPEVLGDYRVREDSMLRSFSAHAHGRMRRLMLERFPEAVARDAVALALLGEAEAAWDMRDELLALRAQAARHRAWLRRPDQAVSWFVRRAVRGGRAKP